MYVTSNLANGVLEMATDLLPIASKFHHVGLEVNQLLYI